MKVTFPHMSPVIVYKKLIEMLGHEAVMPPTPTQKTIDLGVKYSPEFACFPLKVILGSYLEAIDKGADVILTSGGNGPCRAGYYGELHKRILNNLGYNVEFIIFDSIFKNFNEFIEKAKMLKGKSSLIHVYKTLQLVYKLTNSIDRVERKMQWVRAYEVSDGDASKAWDEILKIYDAVFSMKELEQAEKKANKLLDEIKVIKVNEDEKLRIGIVGEIFVVMESSINMDIQKTLGRLGAETERSQYLSDWIEYNVIPKMFRNKKIDKIINKGKEFIEIEIGGHARETVGFIKDFKDRGFDGVVHLMPFGCLPELVTQSIVPSMSESLGIPVLTIPLDEQTGKANNQTRIEAFVDLLKSKKGIRKNSKLA